MPKRPLKLLPHSRWKELADVTEARGTASFVGCQFLRNESTTGAAVEVPLSRGAVSFVNSIFVGNRSLTTSALRVSGASQAGIVGCLFAGNAASDGVTAFFTDNSIVTMRNCTVSGNTTESESPVGHVATYATASLQVENSLLWGNLVQGLGGESRQIRRLYGQGSIAISSSSVQDWTGSLGGTGNNGLDPLFLRLPSPGADNTWGTGDDNYGDLRLAPGSPAIDSGDSSAVPADTFDIDSDGNTTETLPIDLLGFPRFVDDPASSNTGLGLPPVDRGCYESQVNCLACPGVREWRSPSGGGFGYAGNWYPSIPGTTNDTIFDLAATYDVVFPAASQISAKSANIRRGDVLFDLSGSTWSLTSSLSPALQVGSDLPTPASLTVTGAGGGTLQAFSALIGTQAGSQGNLHVTGAGTTVRVTNDMSVGFFGKGTALIDGGARLVTRTAGVGDQPGSDGSLVRVTGANSRWDVPFFLTIDKGEVNVSSGGALSAGFGIFLFQDGVLSGDGTINGDVINFGSVVPGNSPGSLTINGSYQQIGFLPEFGANAGRLVAEIAGSPASGNYDRLIVNGPVVLGGLLDVKVSGYTPALDDVYQLVQSPTASLEERFGVALFPSLGPDKFFYATYPTPSQVALTVQTLLDDPNLQPRNNTTVSGTPTAAALGDMDGDGLPDLVVTISEGTELPGSVVIFRNRGGGAGDAWLGFEQSQVIQLNAGLDPRGVVLADLDRSDSAGRLDIAVCNAASNDVHIIGNLGGGAFPLRSIQPVGSGPVALCAFRLDNDNVIDLATANHNDGTISLLRGNNAGGVLSRTDSDDGPTEPDTIEPVNPNTDKPGVVARHLAVGSRTGNSLFLFRNTNGSMSPAGTVGVGPGTVQITCRDVDGDHRGDLLAGNTDGTLSVILNTPARDNADPDGLQFRPAVNVPILPATQLGDGIISLTAFKADGDSDRDIAIAIRSGGVASVRLLRNDLQPNPNTPEGNLAFTLNPLPVEEDINPVTVISDNVDNDNQSIQDLVTITAEGPGGRPGGPFGGRSLGLVLPKIADRPCPPDFNRDEFLDFFDYDDFVLAFETGGGLEADFNRDGFVDFFDYDDFVLAFETGC